MTKIISSANLLAKVHQKSGKIHKKIVLDHKQIYHRRENSSQEAFMVQSILKPNGYDREDTKK